MTDSCPNLDVLDQQRPQEREVHLVSCSSCRVLYELRAGGDEVFSEACEDAELLLAVASSSRLSESAQGRLTQHLASCGRCQGLAGQVLLGECAEEDEGQEDAAWRTPREVAATVEPANDERRILWFGLVALAVAAALLVTLGGEEPTRLASSPLITSVQVEPAIATTPEQPQIVPTKTHASAGATANETQGVSSKVEEAKEKVREQDYRGGLSLCKEALAESPANQQARLVCAIAACNLKDASEVKTHLEQLNERRRVGVLQICLRLGVQVDLAMPAGEALDAQDSISNLLDEAKAQVKSADYQQALEGCQAVLKLEPKHQQALLICSIAACNLGDGPNANRFISQIEKSNKRAGITQICSRLGVKLN